MKQFKECARLHSVNEQVFGHVFLIGFLIMVALIGYGVSTTDSGSPIFILTTIGILSVAFLLLISSNRITYLDDSKSTLEIRWFFAYRFCFRRQRILLEEVQKLNLITITDFEGDKTYQLNFEVLANDEGLAKPTPYEIKIMYSQSLDPILKSSERLGKLLRKKLVRTHK